MLSREVLELIPLAYEYGWRCTRQFEKFYKWDKSYEEALKDWADCKAAFDLLDSEFGGRLPLVMQEYGNALGNGSAVRCV